MKNYIFMLLSFLILGNVCYSEEKPATEALGKFVDNINTFSYLYPQEKVYLHFDNTGYYLGETIWFKAYVTVAENNRFTNFSKVLYTELLTPDGEILESKKYKIENGVANGDFIVRDSLFAGYYEIRAYTRSMLNFGEETVFSRVFPVFDNPDKPGDYATKIMTVRGREKRVPYVREKAPKRSAGIHMDFYPEGGNLIVGISNRVAFKATNKEGENIEVSGAVYDNSGKEVTSFSSRHVGMGSFDIVPSTDNQGYYAKVLYKGKESRVNLPEAIPSGYSIRVNNLHPANMMIQVEKTADILPQEIGLTVSCRGKVYAFNSLKVNESGQAVMRIPKAELPSGVMQVTLFTTEGEVLAERLAFVNQPNDHISVKTIVKQPVIDPYKPIEIDFEIKDNNNSPVKSNLSLAVRDKGAMTETFYADDIRTNLLLSSDLKGFIENPAYYFEADDNEHKAALDLLMLVQGWRRYEWKQMAGIEPFDVKYGIEPGLMIEGHVSSIIKKKPQENIEVKMWTMNLDQAGIQRGACVTDKEGKFNFALDDFYGKWELSLETKEKGKPKHLNIILNRNISPTAKHMTFYETNLPEIQRSENREEKLKEMMQETSLAKGQILEETEKFSPDSVKSYLLDEVTVTEKRKYKMEDMGLRVANIVYDVIPETDKIIDHNEYYVDKIEDFLMKTNQYFSEELERTKKDSAISKLKYKGKDVAFLVDNMPVSQTAWREIGNVFLSDVEKIMISEDPVFNKVIVWIYTNKDGRPRKDARGTRKTYYAGYSHARDFYNPDYNYANLPKNKDFRRTLYWNPNVETDANGQASVSFFNNGKCKNIDISLEGLTDNGIAVLSERETN